MRPRFAGGHATLGTLMRAAPQLATNVINLFDGPALASAPVFATWALTERCQLRCRHCDLGHPREELDADRRLAIARRLARSPVWGISLIGGEPTLVPELVEIASVLKARHKYVNIGTSGLGLSPSVRALVELGVDSIIFGVDSHLASEHDRFRGRSGLFDAVVAAIEEIRARRHGGLPRIQVRCVVHRGNFRALGDFIEFWRTRADNILLQAIQDNTIHRVRDRDIAFRASDRTAFEATLEELQQRYEFLRTPYYNLMSRYLFAPETLRRALRFRCLLVPATSMVIQPDGEVELCPGRTDTFIGNIKGTSVKDLWRGERTRAARARMQSADYGCMCWELASSGNLDLLPVRRGVDWLRGLVRRRPVTP